MYSYKRSNLPKNAVEFIVTVPWADIQEKYAKSFEILRLELKTEGFRKGKVPKDVAEKNIDRRHVYEHLLRAYIPDTYAEVVKKEELKPVISPKIELIKAQENEDWEIKMTTALTPDVKLGKYKEKVKAAKEKVQKSDIWVPGKDKEPTKEDKDKQEQAVFQASLDALLSEAKVEISELILEEEVSRRLAKLVDDIQKVGLTMSPTSSQRI
jgi:trigger factor